MIIYKNIKNKEDQICLRTGVTHGVCVLTLPSATLCECHGHATLNYSLTGQVLEGVMDAKYLGVTLSNDLEWSKHIATMTNKANSNFVSASQPEGCVSDMLDVLGWTPLSQRRQQARLVLQNY